MANKKTTRKRNEYYQSIYDNRLRFIFKITRVNDDGISDPFYNIMFIYPTRLSIVVTEDFFYASSIRTIGILDKDEVNLLEILFDIKE